MATVRLKPQPPTTITKIAHSDPMGHFYDNQGRPRFDVGPTKAMQEGLLFSVNEQFKMLAKPGLEMWKDLELAKAAYHEPPLPHESEKDFVKRVKAARYRRTSGAADLGTAVHKEIEDVLSETKQLEDVPDNLYAYVAPAVTYVKDKEFVIEHIEKVVVSMEHTFAGTCDLIGTTKNGQPFVADWKTKKSTPDKPFIPYPENKWQVCSYAVAHFGEERVLNNEVWGVNIFISSTELGDNGLARFEAHSYRPEEMAEAWETAKLLYQLHRKIHEYDPRS